MTGVIRPPPTAWTPLLPPSSSCSEPQPVGVMRWPFHHADSASWIRGLTPISADPHGALHHPHTALWYSYSWGGFIKVAFFSRSVVEAIHRTLVCLQNDCAVCLKMFSNISFTLISMKRFIIIRHATIIISSEIPS